MIAMTCSGCQSKLKLKPHLAGRLIQCPKCQTQLLVPGGDVQPAASSDSPAAASESSMISASPPSEVSLGLPRTESLGVPLTTTASAPYRRRRGGTPLGVWLFLVLLICVAGGIFWYMQPRAKVQHTLVQQLPPQTATEGKELKVKIPITFSGSGAAIQLKVVQAPAGLVLDEVAQQFTWTPTEADGPGDVAIKLNLIEGERQLELQFTITVIEVDDAPVFTSPSSFAAQPLEEVRLSVAATDPDLPSNTVTYSLINPTERTSTATIHAKTGQVTWTPPELAAGEKLVLTVRATEESVAGKFTEQPVAIDVARFKSGTRQLITELRKNNFEVDLVEIPIEELPALQGTPTSFRVNGMSITGFDYESIEARDAELSKLDEQTGQVAGKPWTNTDPLRLFSLETTLVAYVGGETPVLDALKQIVDQPVAIVRSYVPPAPMVKEIPALVAALSPLYEERATLVGKPRKLLTLQSYAAVRKVFADEFASKHEIDIKTALGSEYDEWMSWFETRTDLKEEFYTALRPGEDDIIGALRMFNEIRTEFPKHIEKYGNLAIAVAVVWDNRRGVYTYNDHAQRTHSTLPTNMLNGLDNFRYFVEAESVMQGRAQFVPWEFLIHMVNHETPVNERAWAVQGYLPSRVMFGKCYSDVPYDDIMLATSSRTCRLEGQEYNLPNIRQFGGVCSMQADFAARVGKSLGVPAEYVTGEARTGGAGHAWVMWVELQAVSARSIQFSLESHGRYRGDHYYVGDLSDPQTGQHLTDRQLELRLHQVGVDAPAQRHVQRLMVLYPDFATTKEFDFETRMEYLSGAVGLNPWSPAAWTAAAQIHVGRELDKVQMKTLQGLLNQMFTNFAVFPDFTLTIFNDMIAFEPDAKKRIGYYYQLLDVYAAAGRPDLSFQALLTLTAILEENQRSGEAIQALATAIQKYADEGQYVPKMLDRLEQLAADNGATDQTLAEFYQSFLPKIPQTRGDAPSEYCIQMYERAIPIFTRTGATQLAQSYQVTADQMKAAANK